jgi:hypothetical protein
MLMGKVNDAVLEVRPGSGQGKTIPLPITTLAVLQSDGTAQEVDASNPAPVSSVPGALVAKTSTWLAVAISTPGTAQSLAASNTFYTSIRIVAKREDAVNTGDVYIGPSGVNKDTAHYHTLSPGDTWETTAAPGTKLDIGDLYLDAVTATDGIVMEYNPA